MSVVYEKRFHVGGDLSRPMTKEGNKRLLEEIQAADHVRLVCIQTAEQFQEWMKDYKSFSALPENEKETFIRCLKFWFRNLKARMQRFKIQKESFGLYGVSWADITNFVYQF